MELVRDRWYIVMEADEVPARRPVLAERLGERLVVWRDQAGVVRATADRCPHRGASLALGAVVDGEVQCPFHGFRFAGDGHCTAMPVQGGKPPPRGYAVTAYTVREAHGFVWLWWGDARPDLPEIPWFHDLDLPRWHWRAGRFHDDWPIHWTRVVENQLDFAHLPFVHATSIGRFVTPPMDVVVETDGEDRLTTYVSNQEASRLDLVAPNLWRNQIGANTYVMAVFVPISETLTRTYTRYYQADVSWRPLAWLYGTVMGWANRWILSQDRRVVTSQRPAHARLGNGEKLHASDAAIIWFRRWQAERAEAVDAEPASAEAR